MAVSMVGADDWRLLEEVARQDPLVAPLALPQAVALRAAADPHWKAGLPSFARPPGEGVPLLHGCTLPLDQGRVLDLLLALVDAAQRAGVKGLAGLHHALAGDLPALALLEAAINHDAASLSALARSAATPGAPLATIAHLASLPALRAAAHRAGPPPGGFGWQTGYCPVCGAWATMAEERGVERERWLHCARCATAWRFSHHVCVYCGNADYHRQGYLAAEGQREARRVDTCAACRGYLKTLAASVPLTPVEVATADLRTLDLDLAALDRGYARPDQLGHPLAVRVVASSL